MNRKIAGVSIVAVWLMAIGFLLQRERFGGMSNSFADATLTIPPGAVFYSVELGGEQIGFASSTVDTVPDEGIFVREVIEINLPVGNTVQRLNSRTEVMLDRALRLRTFKKTVQGDGERYRVEGIVSDSFLLMEVQTETGTHSTRVEFAPRTAMLTFVPMKLVFGGEMRAGFENVFDVMDTYSFSVERVAVLVLKDSTFMVPDSAVLDSTTMTWSPVHYDTVHAWNTEYRSASGLAHVWVDDLGRIVSLTTPQGYTIRRSVFEVVYENFRTRDTTAEAAGKPPAGVSRLSATEATADTTPILSLTVVFPNVLISDRNQTVRGDTVTVSVTEIPESPPYRLGFRSVSINRFLEPDALVRSRDPRIGATARRIIRGTGNPITAIRRLVEWTSEADLSTQAHYPDVLRTIERHAGNTNELVTAFTAMARAVGVPTRIVGGLLLVDGRFYHHSWAEVFLQDWTSIDPVFAQIPADASHLRLVEGLNRTIPFLQTTGILHPKVIDVRR